MADLSDLYPSLRIELPGVIEPLLEDEVVKAVQDFLIRSGVWKHTCPDLLPWETVRTFPVLTEGTDIPTNTRVTRLDEVKFASDGTSLKKVKFATREQLDDIYSNWEVKTGSTPLRWTSDGPGAWRIVPIAVADVADSIKIRVVLSITNAATEIPDFIFYEFEESLKYGALSRLMKIPGKDWTDLKAAAAYASMFESKIIVAASRAQAEFGHPRREVAYGGI